MKKNFSFLLVILFIHVVTVDAKSYRSNGIALIDSIFDEQIINIKTFTGVISATLTTPQRISKKVPLILIIPGAGDIDRNGNNIQKNMVTNTYKLLAIYLAEKGIASVRYDKRLIGLSTSSTKLSELGIEDYVDDATDIVNFFKDNNKFSKIVLLSHGQGVLIGSIVVSDVSIDKFIAIDGTSEREDKVLTDQMSSKPSYIAEGFKAVLDSLRKGKTKPDVDLSLYYIAKPDRQHFLMSWCRYDPLIEFKNIKCPLLIIQGANDLNSNTKDAIKFKETKRKSEISLFNDMDYNLKIIKGKENTTNVIDYNNVQLDRNFADIVVNFVKQ